MLPILPALDGLRGIAVLLVMLHHFWLVPSAPRSEVGVGGAAAFFGFVERVAMAGAASGWIGVDLFFVLSGFLITGILLDTKGSRSYFRTFYIRRTLRIFPLYYVFVGLLLSVPQVILPGLPTAREAIYDTAVWYATYTSNFLIAWKGWEAVPLPVGHLWSLAIEEQFYLVWPLVVFAVSTATLRRTCLGILAGSLALRCAASALGLAPEATYVFTLTRIDALAVGALVALTVRDKCPSDSFKQWRMLGAGAAALLALFILRYRAISYEHAFIQTVGYTAIALMFGALVLYASTTTRGGVSALLRSRSLCWLGRRSYAVYIIHVPVIYALVGLGLGPSMFPPLFGTLLPGRMIIFLLATAASLALAEVSWAILERPLLKVKQRFGYSKHESPPRTDLATAIVATEPPKRSI